MIIINSVISIKIFFLILLKDLEKTCIYINKFGIIKVKSNKISQSDINNIIFKIFYNDLDFKLISNIDNFFNKTKKNLENIKPTLVKK